MSTPPEHAPDSVAGQAGHEQAPPGPVVATPTEASQPHAFPAAPPPPPDVAPSGPPLASRGLRLVARILDAFLFTAVLVVLVVALVAVGRALDSALGYAESPDPDDSTPLVVTLVAVGIALAFTISYLYFSRYLYRHGGQTLGKRACGIRVVRVDGSPLTAREARRRWFAYEFVSLLSNVPGPLALMFFYVLLDVLWLLWDRPYRQCLHDKAAKTVVVKVAHG